MNKIALIAFREILQKIKSPSFIVMTFLTPFLLAGFVGFIIYLSQTDKTEQRVWVLDESKLFLNRLQGNEYTSFVFSDIPLPEAVKKFSDKGYTCILWISPNIVEGGDGAVKLLFKKSPGLAFQNFIRGQLEKILYEEKLRANHIDPVIIQNARQKVQIIVEKIDRYGNTKDQTYFQLLGFFMGAFMFIFITTYGMMVFRSVIEEKSSRIVEIIVSSVRPFQLLLGKITGIALLGIMQFTVMALTSLLLIFLLMQVVMKDTLEDYAQFKLQQEMVLSQGATHNLDKLEKYQEKIETFQILEKLKNIDVAEVILSFLVFFLGGFLLYSSLMAAIASAVDAEADSQQFLFPVMIPLIASYMILIKAMENPDSSLIEWTSYIPFTSPVIMISRIPSGVPLWEFLISVFLLYGCIFLMVLLAARIYRTGILMYGQKASWKLLLKWALRKG